MSRPPSPDIWRLTALQAAMLLALGGLPASASAIELFFTASARGTTMKNGDLTSGEQGDSGVLGASASAPNASASGLVGTLTASSSSSARASGVLAGPPFTSSGGSGDASVMAT